LWFSERSVHVVEHALSVLHSLQATFALPVVAKVWAGTVAASVHLTRQVLFVYASCLSSKDKPAQADSAFFACEERNRLLNAILDAIRELNSLQSDQVQAMIGGDPEFRRFDLLIHLAQERKEKAKYAWIEHVESHNCGGL
jgi:hypothetical protein